MKKIATICIMMMCAMAVHASDTLVLYTESNNYLYGNNFELLEDAQGLQSIDEAIAARGWQSLKGIEPLNLPKANTNYWIRFHIKNLDTSGLRWMLEFPDGHNSFLQLYQFDDKNKLRSFAPVGLAHPIRSRPFDYKNFLFEAPVTYGETFTYYAHIRSRYRSSFWSSVRTTEFLLSYFTREYYFLGAFYGIIFIMAMYNFLIFIFTREKVYLLYVFYVLSCGFYSLSEDLLGFQLFWPNISFFNHWHFENAPSILIIAFILYAVEFLDLKKHFPKFIPVLYGMSALNFCTTLFLSSYLPAQAKAILYVAPFAIIYYQASRLYFINNYKPARFFLVGFSVILCSFLIFVLRMYDIIPGTLYTIYIFNFGFVVEVMIFSYALGDKIRIIKEEKEKSQQKIIEVLEEKEQLIEKINRELEQKVDERTLALRQKSDELKTANENLTYLTEQLNKMNAQLDIDNWNLKKQVQSETRSRILTEKVSYEEFLAIFPNDAICMQYLENLKWEQGYICKKCNCNHYGEGEKIFSRKCTRCKYTESVTAGTLFHAIKFPLNKAFYITYDAFKETSSSLDELSTAINLRKATTWAFRRKVLESKTVAINHKKSIQSWNDIILDQ